MEGSAQMPLLEALQRYTRQSPVSLHVPGHKWGRGLLPQAEALRDVMQIDATELNGLDDLHHPEGVIREAQRLAASCFGAEETCFLINGSTVGNLAAVLSTCRPGDLLIVQRNVHKSVLHGLMLAQARAVFVSPAMDPDSGLAGAIEVESIREAIERYPQAKGVLVTSPNYYGLGSDIRRIADAVHEAGMILIVDEAHGAHYGFHPELPESALAGRADLVIQSTHKMLSAMTMGAMLHMQGNLVERQRVRQCLAMLQSSSPSYPIMASLDASRCLLQTEGELWLDRALDVVRRAEGLISELAWASLLHAEQSLACATKDPFKIALRDGTGKLSGFELRDELEQRGIMAEMADPDYVLLVFSLSSQESDALRLGEALTNIGDVHQLNGGKSAHDRRTDYSGAKSSSEAISQPVSFAMFPSEEMEDIPLTDAVGRICGEMLIPYPPGIPIVYPGEILSESKIREIRHWSDAGAKFQGAGEREIRTIRVCKGE